MTFVGFSDDNSKEISSSESDIAIKYSNNAFETDAQSEKFLYSIISCDRLFHNSISNNNYQIE